jgi:hypothetical protein
MRRVRETKDKIYSKEKDRKSIRNHKRGNRRDEKARRNRNVTQKEVGKQPAAPISIQ